jgi:hypothetical protein
LATNHEEETRDVEEGGNQFNRNTQYLSSYRDPQRRDGLFSWNGKAWAGTTTRYDNL